MLTDHTLGDLAAAALAVNTGYLALDRFRYQEKIGRILATARSFTQGMPETFHQDKAWLDLDDVNQKGGPGEKSPKLHWIFENVFTNALDRQIASFAAAFTFLLLAIRPYIDIGIFPRWVNESFALENILLWMMILSVTVVVLWINIGRRCVSMVTQVITENLTHLGRRYLTESQGKIDDLQAFVTELKDHDHGI